MFDTAALQSSLTELQLEAEFPGALERGEFAVVYQPVVAIASSRIVGFEALLRWHHPVLGVIAPLDFVPLAERSGFIVPLGRWALRQACTQLAAWQGELPWAAQVWMAVNVSTAQLGHATLVDDVAATLRESGLQPDRLVLEVTESLAMEDPTGARSVLMELRTRGVRVSIDDFGTGHSSLASLGQLPLDALKMDRSFVRGIEVRARPGRDRRGRAGHGAPARPARHRRGHRDRGAAGRGPIVGLRIRAGLPVRQAHGLSAGRARDAGRAPDQLGRPI